MAVDPPKPPPFKLDLDNFIATALSATPQEIHPFFESFRSLYNKKSVQSSNFLQGFLILFAGYGISSPSNSSPSLTTQRRSPTGFMSLSRLSGTLRQKSTS
jgi:hypothetical protein